MCRNKRCNLFCSTISNATGYSWILPQGATIMPEILLTQSLLIIPHHHHPATISVAGTNSYVQDYPPLWLLPYNPLPVQL